MQPNKLLPPLKALESTRKITIPFNWMRFYALLYLTLPITLFFTGWLKWYFALPAIAALSVGAFFVFRGWQASTESPAENLSLSLFALISIAVVVLAWSFLAGQGGFFYQSNDHHWRNAIFRDLINHSWPVRYPQYNAALVYYIAHWLVPAFFGKIFALIGGPQLGWLGGNIALYLWTSCGLFITAMLLIQTVGATKKYAIGIALFCLVFFSGLDIVGILGNGASLANLPDHLEWWARYYQFSSNTTLLFWVYNQTVVPWMVVLLILNEKKVSNFAFLGISVLPFAPFPFVGMAIIMASLAAKRFQESYQAQSLRQLVPELFSIQNLLAVMTMFPIIGLYFGGNASTANQGFRVDWTLVSGTPNLMMLLIFCLLEFGIYALVLFPTYKKDLVFLTAVISLLVIPVFKMGLGSDFAMRTSIPALFIVMIYTIRHLIQTIRIDGHRLSMPISTGVLVGALLLGSVTPMIEYQRAFRGVSSAGKLNAVADEVITLDRVSLEQAANFLAGNTESNRFFKYLSK